MEQRRIKRGWMNLRVDRVENDTSDTDTFFLVDADEGGRCFDYNAGQYLTFRFDTIGEKPIVRSYTMSSAPRESHACAFTVKRVVGGVVSNWLCDHVKVGTILRARGPIGRFCFEHALDQQNLFMISAGSGVTPFLSIMHEYFDRLGTPGAPKNMTLLVSFRSKLDIIGRELLNKIEDTIGNRVLISLSREDATIEGYLCGRIDTVMIRVALPSSANSATYMICGPDEMMAHARGSLIECGVAEKNIKLESFNS